MNLSYLIRFFPAFIAIVKTAEGFNDEAIFEDEDIYRQALPPDPHQGLTAPGTKWCGPGNTAANYNELGTQRDTDICCRDHDNCDDIIPPQSSQHNLNNTDWFPILKCKCEQKFLNCLQAANTAVSNTMGRVYYGARSLCFGFGHPIVTCKQYQEGVIRKRCVLYVVDTAKEKIWQFYEMPFYTNINEEVKLKA